MIAALGALLVIPLWAYGTSPVTLAIGAFFMQFAVQGAWGIVPVHLNELSPHDLRGTFPGFAYQTGNLLASVNATLQASLAHANGGNYAFALALVAAIVAVVLAALTALGIEARGVKFPGGPENPTDSLGMVRPSGQSIVRVTISGRVQGVGYRAWTEMEATARGVRGWVRNRSNGDVEALFAGDAGCGRGALRGLLARPRARAGRQCGGHASQRGGARGVWRGSGISPDRHALEHAGACLKR